MKYLANSQFKKRGINKKTKTIAIIIVSIIVICGLIYAVKLVNNWYDKHFFEFKAPVEVKLNQPVTIKERKPIVQKIVLDYPVDLIDTPIKVYICEKFGLLDCKIALSIVQAESGFNDQAMNVNTNGSVDLGLWQINFPTHKGTISPKDALDPYKATDWAYAKFKRDGNFNAWIAYTTNRHLVFYK